MIQQSQEKCEFTLHKNLLTNVHRSSIQNHPKLEITKMPFNGIWINKLLYFPVVEYYSVMKKNEFLTHAMTWMTLKAGERDCPRRLQADIIFSKRQNCGN